MSDKFDELKKAMAERQNVWENDEKYNFIGEMAEGVKCFQEKIIESNGGLFGYLDSQNVVIIAPKYVDAKKFSDDLAAVALMVVNKEIKEDLQTNDSIFSKLLKVVSGDNLEEQKNFVSKEIKYGFINQKGETIIDFIFDEAYSFSEGWAVVKVNKQWFFIDKNNKQKIAIDIDSVSFPFVLKDHILPVIKDGKSVLLSIDSFLI